MGEQVQRTRTEQHQNNPAWSFMGRCASGIANRPVTRLSLLITIGSKRRMPEFSPCPRSKTLFSIIDGIFTVYEQISLFHPVSNRPSSDP